MRRLVWVTLLSAAVAAPAAGGTAVALAAAPADGTLAIRAGAGVIELKAFRGAVIGRVGKGTVTVTNPATNDCADVLVWGAEDERIDANLKDRRTSVLSLRCVYSGKGLRFRLVGSLSDVRLTGTSISVSAAGTGFVFLKGSGGDDGTIAANAEEPVSLPDERYGFFLNATAVVAP